MNLYEAQKFFWNELKDVIKNNNMESIYVNVYIGTAIQDCYDYVWEKRTETIRLSDGPFLDGTFDGAKVFIDANKKYSDQKLYDKEGNIIHDFSINFGHLCLI